MSQLRYIDTHAHITDEAFQADFTEVRDRIVNAGIDRVMIITLNPEETKKALRLKAEDPERYQVAAGIFPEDTAKITDESWESFCRTAADPMVDCIGEIGLDYYWVKDPEERKIQREYFIRQIELAKSLHKPIAVHSRDAAGDTYEIMKEHQWHGLMHCFSGTKEMAAQYTKLGYYIALGGPVTFKNARHAAEVCAEADERYLLSETDCPYMAPVPMRGRRNEPSYIPYIVRKMAELRGVAEEYMTEAIWRNWERFRRMERPE